MVSSVETLSRDFRPHGEVRSLAESVEICAHGERERERESAATGLSFHVVYEPTRDEVPPAEKEVREFHFLP